MVAGWKGVERRRGDELANPVELGLHPWTFKCPELHCFYAVSADSEEDALRKQQTHECPYWGGPTTFGKAMSMTTIELAWVLMDEMFAKLMNDDTSEAERNNLRYELRGAAKVVAMYMGPVYRTVNEVADEVKKRYNERVVKRNLEYETQGLNNRRYDFTGIDEKGKVAPKAGPDMQERLKVLTEQEKAAIKFAHANAPAQFTVPLLANTYDCSEGLIREVLGLT